MKAKWNVSNRKYWNYYRFRKSESIPSRYFDATSDIFSTNLTQLRRVWDNLTFDHHRLFKWISWTQLSSLVTCLRASLSFLESLPRLTYTGWRGGTQSYKTLDIISGIGECAPRNVRARRPAVNFGHRRRPRQGRASAESNENRKLDTEPVVDSSAATMPLMIKSSPSIDRRRKSTSEALKKFKEDRHW